MFPHFILLAAGLAAFLPDVRVSSCDEDCADKPVFTPSSLVVKHGDPTNATCLVCQSCPDNLFGLEKSVGDHSTKGPTVLWTVDKMTEWEPSPKCYYNAGAQKCCSTLPVTVYKPPDRVSFSSDTDSDRMVEGEQYTLSCTVEQVAPVKHVRVTFYRGTTPLGPALSVSKPQKTPANEVYMVNITPSKEDNNSEYWCEAKLDLGPGGPRHPPVVKSQRIVATVNSNCLPLVPSVVTNCTDPPVFSPSRLVVRHGDPTSATCSVCQSACINTTFGLEKSVGDATENGAVISWSIDSLTEWGIFLLCYYNEAVTGDQCCAELPVTIYKPPSNVSISVSNHSGPVLEGRHYTLLCTVRDVAPVKSLTVTFYRGQTPVAQSQSYSNTDKPVTETHTLNVTMRKEDDGARYWCKAELELGPEGPQRPPVVTSQSLTAIVYYEPRLEVSSRSTKLIVKEGDSLLLNCSAVGNPDPRYTWTLPEPQNPPPASSILTIQSASSEDGGTYTCSASNMLGSLHVTFDVEVRPNYIPWIIAAVLIAALLLIICVSVAYVTYYKQNRTGQYNIKGCASSRQC